MAAVSVKSLLNLNFYSDSMFAVWEKGFFFCIRIHCHLPAPGTHRIFHGYSYRRAWRHTCDKYHQRTRLQKKNKTKQNKTKTKTKQKRPDQTDWFSFTWSKLKTSASIDWMVTACHWIKKRMIGSKKAERLNVIINHQLLLLSSSIISHN